MMKLPITQTVFPDRAVKHRDVTLQDLASQGLVGTLSQKKEKLYEYYVCVLCAVGIVDIWICLYRYSMYDSYIRMSEHL